MKSYKVLERMAAALICMLIINTIVSAFPPYPWAAPACAAEESSPLLKEISADSKWSDGTPTLPASPSQASGQEEGSGQDPFDTLSATLSEAPVYQEEEDIFPDYVLATPSEATPLDASELIVFIDAPPLAVLEAGEADDNTWQDMLPQQALSWTESSAELWCGLKWSVPYGNWDQPGIYLAQVNVIPPDGYTIKEEDRSYDALVSIHPPGTSQVIDVFAFMRYGMKGHTWTFAMKAGQDMTPLVEALENITVYSGLLDDPAVNISFSAEWDFSSVDPSQPGIYPIYRTLTLIEDSLPENISPEEIYMPDYWRDLPVLFSVEVPEGPQLYGVLENPYDFFGSYARLSEGELESLEVWYSINGGKWTLQTNEGLMDTYEKDFFIHKDAMAEGSSYSFRLKLGDFISRELTVRKDETSPVWFTYMMDGNRDGTIDVEFPPISQPPPEDTTDPLPTEPTGEEPDPSPTEPGEGETSLPPAESNEEEPQPSIAVPPDSADDSMRSDSGNSVNVEWTGSGKVQVTASADGLQPPVPPVPETGMPPDTLSAENNPLQQPGTSQSSRTPNGTDRPESGPPASGSHPAAWAEPPQKAAAADSSINTDPASGSGSLPVPEEAVTRWSTQISGKRVRKLIEIYPDWVLFQKEEVSILLSSQWLREQQMRDSDVLTVSVFPGKDYAVTILINQKEPQTPPICQITVGEAQKDRLRGAGGSAKAALILAITGAVAALFLRRRRRN